MLYITWHNVVFLIEVLIRVDVSEIVINQGYDGLNPMQFGYEYCEPSHSFGPAVRDHWLLHYVVSGCGIFRIGGKTYNIEAGDMFTIPPFIETYYEADATDPWHYIWIGFTVKEALPLTLHSRMHLPEAKSLFLKMLRCKDLETGRSAYLTAKLWDLMALILEQDKADVDYLEKALNCINSEYMNGITVSDIATRLNLDRSYFSSYFKKRTGVSPQDFLLNLRLENARQLMINHGETPTTAANSVGYNDIYNFSRMFKRKYGLSPRAYLDKHKSEA